MKMKSSAAVFLLSACFAKADIAIHVSPCGSDTNSGLSLSKPLRSLSRAQEVVRNMITDSISEDVKVHVAPGKYILSEPLRLEAADSGKNGFTVSWIGFGAIVSGGYRVVNWTEDSNGVYVASVPAGLESRNLFVDGKAANYARRQITRNDFTYTETGMEWNASQYDWLISTPGIQNAEVRFIASFTDRYAPIQAVGDRQLIMKQNSWGNQIIGWDTVPKPFAEFGVFVQNCLALLDAGGEFYLDSAEGKVYYKPLDGEDMSRVDAYLGVQEAIVSIGGKYDNPTHDISFQGFEFVRDTSLSWEVQSTDLWQSRPIQLGSDPSITDTPISRLAVTLARMSPILNMRLRGRVGGRCPAQCKSARQPIS